MVSSCGPDACVMSTVNLVTFIYPFSVSAGPELYKPRTKKISQIYCTGKSPNEGKTVSYHLWDWLSSLELAA